LLIVVLFGFLNNKKVKTYAIPYILSTTLLLYKLDTLLLKQKNLSVLDITGFFFRIRTQVTALVLRSINNSVVDKIYGMAYVFTFLLFRKPNKTTINKNKTTIFIGQRPFGSTQVTALVLRSIIFMIVICLQKHYVTRLSNLSILSLPDDDYCNLLILSVPDDDYCNLLILSVPNEDYSSNVLDEDYSSNVPDEDYSSNVPDEDYSSNESCSTTFDIYIFIPVNDRNSLEAQKVKHPHR
jgi:hypothetical protein